MKKAIWRLFIIVLLICFSLPYCMAYDYQEGALEFNGHMYKTFNCCSTWNEAKYFCESIGGHLATITSKEENEFLFSMSGGNAYFGLCDGAWVTGEPCVYTNWAKGEPNNEAGKERYGMFYWKYKTGKWNDGDGNFKGGNTVKDAKVFICEWDELPAKYIVKITGNNKVFTNKSIGLTAHCTETKNGKTTTIIDSIKWTCSDTKIAQIIPNGNKLTVKGLQPGKVTITATHTPSGASAEHEITIAKKTFEEYFADTIGPHLGTIKGIKLPYSYITEAANKEGEIDALEWSLFWQNLYNEDLFGKALLEQDFFYKTIILQMLQNKMSSNTYLDSLKEQSVSFAADCISLAISNSSEKLSALKSKGKLSKSECKEVVKELEKLSNLEAGIDIVSTFYEGGKSFDEVVNDWCDYAIASQMSKETESALRAMAEVCDNYYLWKALTDVADTYGDNSVKLLAQSYGENMLTKFTSAVLEDTVEDIFEASSLPYKAAKACLSGAEFGTNAICAISSTSESLCMLACINSMDSYAKLALNNACYDYNVDPTYEKACTVVGLYDFLMKTYDYGINECEVYAEYYYDCGLINYIKDVFSENHRTEKRSVLEWIESYNGAVNKAKSRRRNAEIEYGIQNGELVYVVVITEYNGMVIDTNITTQSTGKVYRAASESSITVPSVWMKDTLKIDFSGCYYDEAYTKQYSPKALDDHTVLYRNITLTTTPYVEVNGKRIVFTDQKAIIEDGRTLVPVRDISNALKYNVDWDASERKITLTKGAKRVVLYINSNRIWVNGQPHYIDVPAKIYNDRTLIPLRAVSTAFGCEVDWNAEKRIASIKS